MAIYRENIIDVELNSGTINRSFMSHTIGEGDKKANRFGVRLFKDGEDYTIPSGTGCSGYFIRSAGDTILLSGTVSGNVAYVELTEACYSYEGIFTLAIKLTGGGAIGTMRIVDGVVSNTQTGNVVDPGTILPSIETLMQEIAATVATIPPDYSSLWKRLAQTFNAEKADGYHIGDYVIYDQKFYLCIEEHYGAWDADHFAQTNIGAALARLYYSLILDHSRAVDLSAPINLDELTEQGNYRISSVETAQSEENVGMPANKRPGRVTVMTLYGGTIMQVFNENTSGVGSWCYRLKNGQDAWKSWQYFVDTENMSKYSYALNMENAIRISSGDFDSYTTPGSYYVASTPNAESIANIPTPRPGRLTVTSLLGSVIMQVYQSNNSGIGGWYYRLKNALDDFTPWWYIQTSEAKKTLIAMDFSEGWGGQGFCITDKYIWLTSNYGNEKMKLYKFDKFTLQYRNEMVEYNSGELRHANDFTWNPDTKKAYCAIGNSTSDIVELDEEMTILRTITSPLSIVSLSGVAYDPVTKLWAISGGNNLKIYIVQNLTDSEPLYTVEYTTAHETQGVEFYNGVVYGINSVGYCWARNVFSDLVASVTYDNANLGEYENFKIAGGYVFYNVNNSTDKKIYLYRAPHRELFTNPMLLQV